ncbi:hypothetical protein [Caulobacter sp. NIBR2454]|uniref:hypothetical protein n=1 Tax=Caulobacter sp. NIBR2454 TaxID=3015996 RepID=UPI0022B726E1|nr:hypothetical protein [Caulobacter sp. NIBR2454]
MSNFTTIDSSKGPMSFDLSQFSPVNVGQTPLLNLDWAKAAFLAGTFPAEGVTIDGVTYNLVPIDPSKLDLGFIQTVKSGDSSIISSAGSALQPSSESIWQVPSAEAGSFIELNMEAIDLAGIGFASVDFHTFTF